MLYQLTYRSLAAEGITASDIRDILEEANSNNASKKITGCLVYNEGHFVQLLEGEKDVVHELYWQIEGDKRHSRVQVLSEGETLERMFPDWKMMYLKLPEEPQTTLESQVKKDLKELEEAPESPNFTSQVFWYNVHSLLEEKGFYRPQ